MAEDRARDPKRIPKISFPRELTSKQLAAKRMSDSFYAKRQVENKEKFISGSRNPIRDTADEDERTLAEYDNNNYDGLGRGR